jgi:hypothetical protein
MEILMERGSEGAEYIFLGYIERFADNKWVAALYIQICADDKRVARTYIQTKSVGLPAVWTAKG